MCEQLWQAVLLNVLMQWQTFSCLFPIAQQLPKAQL